MDLSSKDLSLIESKGISKKTVEKQLNQFKNGFPKVNIVEAATIENGIKKYTDDQQEEFVAFFKDELPQYDVMKFVPASGAATRMFKKLFEFMDKYSGSLEDFQKFTSDNKTDSVYSFFETIDDYPFIDELRQVSFEKENVDLETLIENHEYTKVLELLLTSKGMNLGYFPKALIDFHKYGENTRTPVGEHLISALYLFNNIKKFKVHFTIAEEFQDKFQELADLNIKRIKEKYDVDIDISFSYQKRSTDTMAVTLGNLPFRDENDEILFRPGGHGALIHNLNDVDASIVFIKNIDNVVPDRMKEKNAYYEQLLGGVLFKYQRQIFEYLDVLDKEPSKEKIEEIKGFIKGDLCYISNKEMTTVAHIKSILNRPLRVCGMVVNEGEPGGGPFLVKDIDGNISLQIVEGAQIDLKDEEQHKVFDESTHFNPVDIVCSLKDYKGNMFNLLDYVDDSAGFIAQKSMKGRNLKALELPGLWNGAMANWNTVFVEVPDFTFNPVKTVFDLLRPQHRN